MTEGPKNTGEGGASVSADEVNEWERMAQEAAVEAAKAAGQNPDNITEDDLAYQKKQMEMARRGTDFDPLADDEIAKNETNTGINAKGEEYQRMPWNTWDTYARRGKDANREYFDAHNAFRKRIEETMSDLEQGADEDPKAYKKRVMEAVYGAVAQEQADDPSRKLSEVELDSLAQNYPRQEGENTMAWAQRISDETGVRFGAGKVAETEPTAEEIEEVESAEKAEPNVEDDEFLQQCKDWYERIADAKSKFEKIKNIDGTEESDADYERRMNTVAISNISTELANHPDRVLNDVEYGKVTEMYPREKDEEYQHYIDRVKEETGIDLTTATRERMGVDDAQQNAPEFVTRVMDDKQEVATVENTVEGEENGEDAEAKHRRAEMTRALFQSDMFKNAREAFKITDEDLENMTDDEILAAMEGYKQRLVEWAKKPVEEGGLGYTAEDFKKIGEGGDAAIAAFVSQYNEYLGKNLEKDKDDAEGAESAEQMEKLRAEMMRSMSIADLRDMLEAEGVMVDDMENMDAEQLKELQEKLRKRMFEAFGADNGIGDYLERDDIKVDDLEEKDFEGMKDQREVYRQEFIHDLSDESMADKLESRGLKLDDLEAMTMEELLALKQELSKAEDEKPAGEEQESDLEKKDPLIAVINNRERDAKIAARALAEEMFQNKLEGNGKRGLGRMVRNLVFGQMLKDSTMLKYEREAMEAIKNGDSEVRGVDVEQFWSAKGDGASGKIVERLTMAYVNGIEDSLLHGAAGNEMDAFGVETDENGSKVVYKYTEGGNKKEAVDANSAEAKSTIAVREAIEKFAQGKMSEHDFEEAMKFEKARMSDEGLDTSLISDTLLETAKAAKERFNHEESIENVMEGFRLINADYQAQVRTEVHRSKIDEISEKISGKLGIVQPEVIAAAAGIAVFFTQKATTSALRAAVPVVGGALAAGTFAGFKEHNRVAVDRAEQARRIARGEEIGSTKYDRQMQETEYKSYAAKDLTGALEAALKSGNAEQIQQSLAVVEALTKYSDENKVDLIKFTAGDNTTIEDERLALDIQVAQAKVELRKQGIGDQSKTFLEASEKAYEAIESDVDAKDKAFKKLQAKRVAAQFAKTAAIGVATAVVGQEVSAAFNPDSYGLFDKMNDTLDIRFKPLNIGVNNLDAHKTLLAGFLGINQEQVTTTIETITAAEATGTKLTDEQVQQLRNEGYTVNERTITSTENVTRTETLSAAEYAQQNGVRTSMEWGSNGTRISDGNELAAYQSSDGTFYARMSGSSFSGDRTVNFGDVRDNVKLAVSLSGDSQGSRILIDGVVHDDGSVWFPTDDPALSNIIANQEYQAVSVVWDTGEVTSDGARKLFSFASDLGSNSVGEMTQEVTDTIVNTDTVFDVIGFERQATEILQGSDLIKGGVAIPFASRKNLTRGKKGQGHGPSEAPKFDGGDGNNGGSEGNGGETPKPEQPTNTAGVEPNRPTPPTPERPTGTTERSTEQQPQPVEQQPQPVEQQPQPAQEQAPAKPERAAGDAAPITLTGDQIRGIFEGQDNAGMYQARMEEEISRWNSLTGEQRTAIMAGDYSGFDEAGAARIKQSVDFLTKYDVLKVPAISEDFSENEGFKSETDLGEPWGNVVTRVEFTDEEIDALESNEDFRRQLKEAIATWNSASELERRKYMMGDGEVGTKMNDASIMLQNLGKSYIGSVEDVEKTRAEAREIIEARFQRSVAEARARSATETITDPNFTGELFFPDEKIAEMNPGVTIPAEDTRKMRQVMAFWNRLEPSERGAIMSGNYDKATRNPRVNQYIAQNFGLLKKYHIFNYEGGVAAANEEGEAKAA